MHYTSSHSEINLGIPLEGRMFSPTSNGANHDQKIKEQADQVWHRCNAVPAPCSDFVAC